MPEVLGFDLYDEHWRDCWLAATSVARLRKKQIDVDIRKRIAKLLEDYGPQSDKPLTLRIYGTMIKGFCVINNERARSLFCDCERVALMFSRRPFTEAADSSIRLPAAKRPRMEAALTLDLDLARVEASEAFDWTQAPLEEGALLRLGGGQRLEEALLPSLELGGLGDGLGAPGVVGTGLEEAGWLPRLDGDLGGGPLDAQTPAIGPGGSEGFIGASDFALGADPSRAGGDGNGVLPDLTTSSQLVPFEVPSTVPQPLGPNANEIPSVVEPAPWADAGPRADAVTAGSAAAAAAEQLRAELALRRQRRRHEPHFKPGTVYGFDDETMLAPNMLEIWQMDDREIALPRLRPSNYAEDMGEVPEVAEHFGPWLRLVVDPPVDGAPELPTSRGGGIAETTDARTHAHVELLPEIQALADTTNGVADATTANQAGQGPVTANALPETPGFVTEGGFPAGVTEGAAPTIGDQTMPMELDVVPPAMHLEPTAAPFIPEVAAGLAEVAAVAAFDPGSGGAGCGEAQDGRTAEVAEIIRACLQGSGASSAAFHELVPPGEADRPTAACTFSALLALATAGNLGVSQESPYAAIMISLT
eukprot:TRINITY_DN69505_c0_g1_i1.p1 TRINITY_DN69505_c0_g1~~TRINITY_DN69505_c0_g1_i1.p1  ORF type:complete len:615 (-),score=113.75 TRINITY_DN69505_c0_g1_i1:309-2078(-)